MVNGLKYIGASYSRARFGKPGVALAAVLTAGAPQSSGLISLFVLVAASLFALVLTGCAARRPAAVRPVVVHRLAVVPENVVELRAIRRAPQRNAEERLILTAAAVRLERIGTPVPFAPRIAECSAEKFSSLVNLAVEAGFEDNLPGTDLEVSLVAAMADGQTRSIPMGGDMSGAAQRLYAEMMRLRESLLNGGAAGEKP